ncbi:UNVERIFIED_CONTAM: hypothetical protein Slati_1393400 [Sesamum latifolium]|uniref:Uncharacterized protein n=1 Tax=Sesamum latifolium TaxID=2727402 RepID=A0AAW2X4M5_9LAMI
MYCGSNINGPACIQGHDVNKGKFVIVQGWALPKIQMHPCKCQSDVVRHRSALSAVVFHALGAASVVVPSTSCYALDKDSRIRDFAPDLVVRFCKDVETRSQQPGYVDFGRFDKFNHFIASSGHANFSQEYYNGDLMNCEKSFDKLGRTAQGDDEWIDELPL